MKAAIIGISILGAAFGVWLGLHTAPAAHSEEVLSRVTVTVTDPDGADLATFQYKARAFTDIGTCNEYLALQTAPDTQDPALVDALNAFLPTLQELAKGHPDATVKVDCEPANTLNDTGA